MKEFSDLPTQGEWDIYDWQQILGKSMVYNGETDGATVSLGQVYKVHAMHKTSTEGWGQADYAALVELQSGDWATVHAGCDTTGWGCRGDYIDWRIFISKDEAIRMGLTNESRDWLGLGLETISEQG